MQKSSCLDFRMRVKSILSRFFRSSEAVPARQKPCDAAAFCPNLSEDLASHVRAHEALH